MYHCMIIMHMIRPLRSGNGYLIRFDGQRSDTFIPCHARISNEKEGNTVLPRQSPPSGHWNTKNILVLTIFSCMYYTYIGTDGHPMEKGKDGIEEEKTRVSDLCCKS